MIQDLLSRVPELGDKVLTKSYCSPMLDQLATVTKINTKTIEVELYHRIWRRETPGSRTDYRGRYVIDTSKPAFKMKRKNGGFVIVNEQLAYNQEQWPELYI